MHREVALERLMLSVNGRVFPISTTAILILIGNSMQNLDLNKMSKIHGCKCGKRLFVTKVDKIWSNETVSVPHNGTIIKFDDVTKHRNRTSSSKYPTHIYCYIFFYPFF